MTHVHSVMLSPGRYRAIETATGVVLGSIVRVSDQPGHEEWMATRLSGGEGIVRHTTLAGALVEIGLWCDRHPDRMAFLHRQHLAALRRAISPEPLEAAPELQEAML